MNIPNIVLPLLVAPIVKYMGMKFTMSFYTLLMIIG